MARYHYERLSAQSDAQLALEGSRSYAHSLSVLLFDAEPLALPQGGVDVEAITRAIDARLHLAPRFRQRLKWIPYEDHAVWVDDEEFNLEYHVRHTALPHPGSAEQLRKLAARITSQRMHRARPMWECWIAEGLEGSRFALILKTHNCMIESDSGADLLQTLLSPDADERIEPPPPYTPRPAPSGLELVRDEVVRRFRLPRRAIERASRVFGDADSLQHELQRRARAVLKLLGYTMAPPRHTPLNGSIGPHRRFRELAVPLEPLRQAHRVFDCSVHDVVLAAVAGAVRRFLRSRLVHPASLDFRVATPVQTPAAAGRDEIAEWIVDLPVWERDPARVIAAIRAQTRRHREVSPALGAQTLFSMARWSGSRLLTLGAGSLSHYTPVNMSITSVPGSPKPLYLLGARLEEAYGIARLRGEQATALSVISYDDRLFFGINADFDLVPDVDRLAEALEESVAEIAKAARKRGRKLAAVDASGDAGGGAGSA